MKPLSFLKKNTRFILPYLIVVSLLAVIYAITGISFSLFVKNLIDSATNKDFNDVIIAGIILAAIVIFEIFAVFIIDFLLAKMNAKVRTHYQRLVFNNLLSQPSLKEHSGYYLARLTSDISYVVEGVTSIIPVGLSAITKFIGAFIIIGYIDIRLLLFIVVLGVAFVLCHLIYKKFLAKYHRDYQTKEAHSRSFMQEILENQAVVHSFGKDKYIIAENEKRLNGLFKAELKRNYLAIFANSITGIAMLGAYALIIIYGAFKLSTGSPIYDANFTFGGLSAIMSIYTQLQSPLSTIANLNNRLIILKESTKRIMEILDYDFHDDIDALSFNTISINDFSFSYPNLEIFKNASFTINKGESITIKGPSGVGKSTLIKILMGKLKTDKHVLVDEKKLGTKNLISYVPQGNWLLSGTIRDNLTIFDSSISDEKIFETLEICELKDFILSLKDGLDTNILERAKDISEGQAQRIAIARGILLDKPILLLDEVTSALDIDTEAKLLNNLAKLDKTIIYISHKDATNKYSNKVYEIKDYKIIEVR